MRAIIKNVFTNQEFDLFANLILVKDNVVICYDDMSTFQSPTNMKMLYKLAEGDLVEMELESLGEDIERNRDE